jgi:phosphate-selective porin OprO/OprP
MRVQGFGKVLLVSASVFALSTAAQAAATQNSQQQAKIDTLQEQIDELSAQVADLKRSSADQYQDVETQQASGVKVTIDNGRPTISSADGRFTASLRGLVQFDTAYYEQSSKAALLPAAYGPDLSSGSNFRRVYLGLQGKVFGDWSYNLNFDFGGSGGTETQGHIQSVYLEYDGLKPFAFRIGAYPPPANIEDGTSASDTIFLERNAPSDLQRNIAGGDGRDAATMLYTGDTIFGAISYTGNKVSDGAKALAAAGATAAPNYDEQQALLGRLSWAPISEANAHWIVGVNGTYVIKTPDLTPNGTATLTTTPGATAKHTVTLSDPPELTVDSNGTLLATTGALGAKHLTQWGVETAGNWNNLYAQAGYYGFEVERENVAYKVFTTPTASHTQIVSPDDNNFNGWYVQASWILTGESKSYSTATGSFTPPKPSDPFTLDGPGWGAWELAARYSDLDLNDNTNSADSVITARAATPTSTATYTFYNTVRGGDQKIATVGINWYPNSVVRFALDYQWIDINRLQSPATVTQSSTAAAPTAPPAVSASQKIQAVSIRAQISI